MMIPFMMLQSQRLLVDLPLRGWGLMPNTSDARLDLEDSPVTVVMMLDSLVSLARPPITHHPAA